ncbi:MAG: HepT-like ribonuclease domain-containing protein [Mongoliitalea sp.]
MKGRIGDFQRIAHILEAIEEIENYVWDIDFNTFKEKSVIKYASIKQLEIIGEASKHLSNEFQAKTPHIKWREIIGLRNFLVHEYFGVDEKIIWQIITVDIPELKEKLKSIPH